MKNKIEHYPSKNIDPNCVNLIEQRERERLYPRDRPTWIGDILLAIERLPGRIDYEANNRIAELEAGLRHANAQVENLKKHINRGIDERIIDVSGDQISPVGSRET